MTLLLLEGLDDGLLQERWVTVQPMLDTPAESRLGQVIDCTAATQPIRSYRRNLADAEKHATITVGFWFHMTQQSDSADSFMRFTADAGTTTHGTFYVDSTGRIVFEVAEGTYTSDIVWVGTDTDHYIELQLVLHDTAGSFTVWSDGNVVLSETNIDTKSGGTDAVLDMVIFEYQAYSPGTWKGFLGDIYITNGEGAAPYNGNLGDIVVDTLLPNGNGNDSDFMGSDGNQVDNYLLVDEEPDHDGDTTYVESGTDTDRDTYGFDDLFFGTGVIKGIMATAVVRNTGAADNLQISARIAAANFNGATLAAPAGYDSQVMQVWQVSPATAADWTIAEINAAEFGIENVA